MTNINDVAYQKLIDNITALWGEAKSKAVNAVKTELLEANWQTGKYIVEFELKGKESRVWKTFAHESFKRFDY